MKRWLATILLVALAALLVGCGATGSVNSADDVQRISLQRARQLLDSGDAVLYDTRSAGAYASQHAEGAVSFPEEEAAARVDELPDDGTALIFYCT